MGCLASLLPLIRWGETDEYDSVFDNSFNNVDMDAFMDIDEEEVKLMVNGNVKKEAREALRHH